ncbi:MAG: tRNA threonylcarbamoyladenosine dehydratase [Lachnospiraceae bacterium]|nr:tRNA threonylcarbamoyladenosine dehydratase [Lachnospiraceae bacterium]
MPNPFSRTALLIGEDQIENLKTRRIAVFGVGGVGGYVVEALARTGIGHLVLIDNDTVSLTNLNRQIIALHSTIGKYKVDVMRERALDINPELEVTVHRCFFLPENSAKFDFSSYDYVVDAVDTVTAKLQIIEMAKTANVPVISCMGAGNKLDPTAFVVTDIANTKICPLARVMRRELKKRGIDHCKVVYSTEPPITPAPSEEETNKRATPGSVAFVPSVAGLIAAGAVIEDLLG